MSEITDWRECALWEDAAWNEYVMERMAQAAGVTLSPTDRIELKQIAEKTASLLTDIKEAILANDQEKALRLGRIWCRTRPQER